MTKSYREHEREIAARVRPATQAAYPEALLLEETDEG
jgi:hypothetical protein